ncbi:hypothetical protein WA026_011934 [Henosepilachna vigintioctopunctata]|uniref:Uncharacterized protein n=1 Tax=Henosepilachna vigintioctopunctata TaxID=420089 RepID=A0AAW1VAE3_9CUCU
MFTTLKQTRARDWHIPIRHIGAGNNEPHERSLKMTFIYMRRRGQALVITLGDHIKERYTKNDLYSRYNTECGQNKLKMRSTLDHDGQRQMLNWDFVMDSLGT